MGNSLRRLMTEYSTFSYFKISPEVIRLAVNYSRDHFFNT